MGWIMGLTTMLAREKISMGENRGKKRKGKIREKATQ